MSINIQLWGNTIWYLFHGLLYKLDENKFLDWRDDFFYILKTICSNLPCPTCKEDANNIIKKTNFNTIKNKEDLTKYIFDFHNHVNKKLKKPIYEYKNLDIYEKINLTIVINNFIKIFKANSNDPQLMGETFHRKKTLPIIINKINNLLKYTNN